MALEDWNGEDNKYIIGKTITAVYVSDDHEALKFDTTDGEVYYNTEGDCCSQTWINDLTGIHDLIGKTVSNVEALQANEVPADIEEGWEFIQHYGERIKTDKGDCIIAYRNSSNGYYGGFGWFTDEPVTKVWKDISDTDDWSVDG